MKTRREIILETAATYNSYNRADNGYYGCEYLAANGNMCAVGRCLIDPPDAKKLKENNISITAIGYLKDNKELIKFKPEYDGHPTEFWADLQFFHDLEDYWTTTGLSSLGEDKLQKLLNRWGDDEQV